MATDQRIREWEATLRAGGTIRPTDPEYDSTIIFALIASLRHESPPQSSLAAAAASGRVQAIQSGGDGKTGAENAVREREHKRK
jgi:hypothetical protein